MPRLALRFLLAIGLVGAAVLTWGYIEATSTPRVRRTTVALPDWPANTPPLTVLLISDIHVAGPDMPPQRLARIVEQINRLKPDLVLIAGDFVSDKGIATRHYDTPGSIAPLASLRSRLGTVAVLGNHDHWRDADASRQALRRAGVVVLDNQATRVGPLVIAGVDDLYTDHADPTAVVKATAQLRGPAVLLSHSPDIVPRFDRRFGLVLAGHTHCGQVVLPLIGRLATASNYGERYACGLIREKARTIIVTAGLGTSMLPIRIGAPPDMWKITIGGGKIGGPGRGGHGRARKVSRSRP
jgi:predicted MPP superfamily phosphohydrolase